MSAFKRFLPLLVILLLLGAGYMFGLHRILSWEWLAARQADLRATVAMRPVLSALGFVGIYTVLVATSFPGASFATVASGLLFGTVLGAGLAVVGATLGAAALFLAARGALRPMLERRAGPLLEKIRPRLEQDGFSYMLALRLLPVVPFWLVNLAAALCGIGFTSFVVATLIGIIPGTTVFAAIGAGVGEVLAAGGTPDLKLIFSLPILLPLVGLAALSLAPIGWRYWTQRNG